MPTPFQDALKKTRISSTSNSMDMRGILTKFSDQLEDVKQLHAYRAYLSTMREKKVSAKAASFSLESSVLTQARIARDAGYRLAGGFLRYIQQVRQSDLMPQVIKAMETTGEIDFPAEITAIIKDQGVQKRLQETAIPMDLLKEAVVELQRAKIKVTAANGEATVTVADGQKMVLYLSEERALRLEDGPPQISLSQLLQQSLFDTVVEGFAKGALPGGVQFNLNSTSAQKVKKIDLYEACALSNLVLVTELERHLRKLECSGTVDTHRGKDPAAWILGLLAGGATAVFIGSVITSNCGSDVTLCDIGWFLMGIGFLHMGAGISILTPLDPPTFIGLAGLVSAPGFAAFGELSFI